MEKMADNDPQEVDTANFLETAEEAEGDEYAFIVSRGNQSVLTLNIGDVQNIKFFIDSGASCIVIDRELWENLKENKVNRVSRNCQKRLFAYGSKEPLKIAGRSTTCVQLGSQSIDAGFVVIEGKGLSPPG